MATPYQLTKEEILKKFNTDISGLENKTISLLQKKFGLNVLQQAKQKNRLAILAAQFTDIMIIILIMAAVISVVVGEQTDAYVILAIIFANAWMGFSQEYKAEKSVRLLQKMSAQHATVIRENNIERIEATQLVPGDVILIEAGDIVPADARLIEVNSLKTDEASLTGESHSIEKHTEPLNEDILVAGDQKNMVFKSTIVSNGVAKAVVTAIGMQTEIGKIAGLLEVRSKKTPLQKRLTLFSQQLSLIVIFICIAIFAFGWLRNEAPFEMFLTALSLAVAALPEALPAVISIALAQGANAMVKQKALIRKLPAVETLGSVTYICSDKTGTLTQNLMTVERVQPVSGKEDLLNNAMLLCNDVRFAQQNQLHGDSTETALVKYAVGNGLSRMKADSAFPLVAKLPFDSQRMRMSTLHKFQDRWVLFVKGAPAKIIEALSEQHNNEISDWLNINRQWASEGLRVLFFGYKILDEMPTKLSLNIESNLDFLGTVAMIDPPRQEVIEAIQQCKTAGIKPVMITGDQPLTATAIARRLHIIENEKISAMTGVELEKLSAEQLQSEIQRTVIYARVSPEQKLNIVKSLQAKGEFVAMTGDGVNDAPSLKQADIGVAMGITGTDVSKEVADMILLDDNFATIVKAVREGRRIYENIRKFIVYILSCNLAEILTIVFAPVFGFAIPLLPIHILWINLVTDGLPGLALVAEPAEKDIMDQPPRSPKESLFAGGLMPRILFTGLVLSIVSLFVQWWAVKEGYDLRTQQTAVFTTLCLVQLANALSIRSIYRSMFSRNIFANRSIWIAILFTVSCQLLIVFVPQLNSILKTKPLSWDLLQTIILVTIVSTLCVESIKYVSRLRIVSCFESIF